jgi:hypothetical protein
MAAMLAATYGTPGLVVSAILVTLGLMFKESMIPALPLLWAWACWRFGGFVAPTVAYALAGLAWFGFMTWLIGETPLTFFLRLRKRPPSTDPYQRLIRGGSHRLLVDLLLVSPIALLGAAHWVPTVLPLLGLICVVGLLGYGLFILQEIRIAIVLDVTMRLAFAATAPWWATLACGLVDIYVWRRVWYKGGLYDPTTVWLAQLLGMGP